MNRNSAQLLRKLQRLQGLRRGTLHKACTPSFSTAVRTTTTTEQQQFPSIIIQAGGKVIPQGSFAEAQAQYLDPDAEVVSNLSEMLLKADAGIVAHYYMDVELQGVLNAIKNSDSILGKRVVVADSLAMGDAAVKMVEETGVKRVFCLGVDFMAESVGAVMARSGHADVPVYRLQEKHIGCSLAESAERPIYKAWLQQQKELARKENKQALHVIYINTSMETKATATSIVPTICCTSSNVLSVMLQASAQYPDMKILYGPDTYMGNNLTAMLATLPETYTDEQIKTTLHPQHTRESLRRLKDNLVVFPHGNCVVHHMFGADVVNTVKQYYDDAYVTAHLEVPGEMFEIAMEKSLTQNGSVGSTSDILKFITQKVQEEANKSHTTDAANTTPKRLKFVLGTEAGMVTSIVENVQRILSLNSNTSNKAIEAEIIFPVASEAISSVEDNNNDLSIVPGVQGGEGCSTAGGCATCPFMKMNDVDSLSDLVEKAMNSSGEDGVSSLKGYLPPQRLNGEQIELGARSILAMRKFMLDKNIPGDILQLQ